MRRFEVVRGANYGHEFPFQVGEPVPARLPPRSTAIEPRFDNQQAQSDSFVNRSLDKPASDAPIDKLLVGHCQIAVLAAGMSTMLQLDSMEQPHHMY